MKLLEKLTPRKFHKTDYLCTMLLACAVSILFNVLMNSLVTVYSDEFLESQELLTKLSPSMLIFTTVVFAPFVEEGIFRFLLFRLPRKLLPFPAAALISALLFALLHGNIEQGIYAFMVGFFLCSLYEKSGQFIVAVLFHATANIASCFVVLFPTDSAFAVIRTSLLCLSVIYLTLNKIFDH